MNPVEVHSRLIGCTVSLVARGANDGSGVGVGTEITTGDVPELCVRFASGRVEWVEAEAWSLVDGGELSEGTEVRWRVPKIPYVEKAHV